MMGVSEAVRCDVVRRVEDYDSNAVGGAKKAVSRGDLGTLGTSGTRS